MNLHRFLTLKIRRERRHQAGNDLFVILDNMPVRHQICDISTRGLSYHYVSQGHSPRSGTIPLKIVAKDNSISLYLDGRNIVELETGEYVSGHQTIKRRGIRFEKMNRVQKMALKRIIKDYSVKPSIF